MKRILLAALAPLLLAAFAVDVSAADIEARAREIEGKLMAPCCMANTVAEHHSGVALEIRQGIREMLGQGQTSDQILAHYAAEYGDQVLAMPASTGFNLVPWLVPMVLLLVGPALIYLVVRGWTSKHAEAQATEEPAAPIDPKYAARLQKSLAELD